MSSSAMSIQDRRARLVSLLLSMFTSDELRRLVRYGPDGDQIERGLPGATVSPLALADALVLALEGRGLLHSPSPFIDNLCAERPRRADEIRAVQALWTGGGPAVTPTPAPSSGPAQGQPVDFAVFTALGLETNAVLALLGTTQELTLRDTGTLLEIGQLQGLKGTRTVAVSEAGMGNISAARLAQEVYSALRPKAAIFIGVAGGIKDVQRGDVVVGTKVYEFQGGKDADTFKPRPALAEPSYRLIQRARADGRRTNWLQRAALTVGESAPAIHFGPIAAGDRVVTSTRSESARIIRRHYSDTLAIEMEGYGFLAALLPLRAEAMVVRGISDVVGDTDAPKTQEMDTIWQPRAARNAAAFAIEVMSNLDL